MLSFVHMLTVPASAIDENGHVNNVLYVQWMQDAAVAHSTAAGGTAMTKALGATWVARRHTIEYKRAAFVGDVIEVRTWISDCRRVSSRRQYEFFRPADKQVLAKGETDWVLIDLATFSPKEIPQEMHVLYNPPGEGAGAETGGTAK